MKILLVNPPINAPGGINGHYKGLKPYFSKEIIYHNYFQSKNTLINKLILPFNLLWLLISIIRKSPDRILINTSLKAGILSRLVYCNFCQIFGFKVILFIHGWNNEQEDLLDLKYVKYTLNKCNLIIVLSKKFETVLKEKKIISNITISSTKVDDWLVKDFKIERRQGYIKNFLFVSRLEKGKGIYEALEVFKKLQEKVSDIKFTIVGNGTEYLNIKEKVETEKIKNVFLKGNLEGKALQKEFQNADFFFLLSYSEGLPAALLEAMAFGLPVATRPVGGIKDFFEDKNIGIVSYELNPEFYYHEIIKMIATPLAVKNISNFNFNYSTDNFLASKVARELEVVMKK